MATVAEKTRRYFEHSVNLFPHLNDVEILAVKSAIFNAIAALSVDIEPLNIQFPTFVDNMIAAPVEALSSDAARQNIEDHRRIGDTELWLIQGITAALVRIVATQIEKAAFVN